MKKLILSALACSALFGLTACGDNDAGLLISLLPLGELEDSGACSYDAKTDNLSPTVNVNSASMPNQGLIAIAIKNTLGASADIGFESVNANRVQPTFVAYQFDCTDKDIRVKGDANAQFCSNIGFSDDRDNFKGDQRLAPLSGGLLEQDKTSTYVARIVLPQLTASTPLNTLVRLQVKGRTENGKEVLSPVFIHQLTFVTACAMTTTGEGDNAQSKVADACWCQP